MMSWIFITAGVGGENFEAAADRLAATIARFDIFNSTQVFKTVDVQALAPEIHNWYSPSQLMELKGYGWYVWKSRFAKAVISNNFKDTDGIMYLDAGCEAFVSSFSKRRLKRYMKYAELNGACFFKIPTPEQHYTKKLVIDRFGVDTADLDDYQFQSGSWLLHGKIARDFINRWDSIVWEDPRFTDESQSPGGEEVGFVCNRYDQAIFSMVARTFSINDCGDVPPGDIARIKSRIKLFFYPFAWARNRSGQTSVPPAMRLLGYATLAFWENGKSVVNSLTSFYKIK